MTDNLKPGELIRYTARNLRPLYKRLRAGDWYGFNVEVDKETWERLKSIPDGALLEIIQAYDFGDPDPDAKPAAPLEEKSAKEPKPKKERKEKPPKGEHGQLWKIVVSRGLLNSPDLWERLGIDGSDLKEIESRLRDAFSVTSRTFISADAFVDWAMANKLDSLASMMRLAEKDLNARQAEAETKQ